MAPEDLIAVIEAAWADATPPTDALTGSNDEGVGAYFAGTTWRGHAVKALRYHSVALSFFEPEAFVYYLPAFLLAVIETPIEADVISDGIVHHLAPRNLERAWGAKYRDTMSRFTAAQRAALVEYLYWYAGTSHGYDDDACEATIAYLTSGQAPVADSAAERLLAIHGRPSERLTLTRLSINSSTVTDDDLTALADFPALEELDVSHTQITSVGLGYIAQRPLTGLDVSRCLQITDYAPLGRMTTLQRLKLANSELSSLDFLAPLQLVELHITHARAITDFSPLDTSKLEVLEMYGVRAPDALCERLTKVREIVCRHVSDAGLVAMPSLRRARISDLSDATTDGGLAALARLPALEELHVSKSRARLPEGFPALTKLTYIESGPGEPVPRMPSLLELGVFADTMPLDCASLAAQPRLESLTFYCCATDDGHIEALAGAPALRELRLITGVLTGTCLATIASLPVTRLRLEQLERFDERHLALLARSNVESLELGVAVSDLRVLRDLHALRSLVLTVAADPTALRAARPDLDIVER